jgi:hypothetical protein
VADENAARLGYLVKPIKNPLVSTRDVTRDGKLEKAYLEGKICDDKFVNTHIERS